MKMGQTNGKTTFLKYMQDFNFGLKTNIDLYGEARTASLALQHVGEGVEGAVAGAGDGTAVDVYKRQAWGRQRGRPG